MAFGWYFFKNNDKSFHTRFIHSRPENRAMDGADEQWNRFSINFTQTAGFGP